MPAEDLDLTERVMRTPSGRTIVLVETSEGSVYYTDEFYDKYSKFRDATELDKIISKALLGLPFELQCEMQEISKHTCSLADCGSHDFHESLILSTASKLEYLRTEYKDKFNSIFQEYTNVFDYLLGFIEKDSFNPLFKNYIKSLNNDSSQKILYDAREDYKAYRREGAKEETKKNLSLIK